VLKRIGGLDDILYLGCSLRWRRVVDFEAHPLMRSVVYNGQAPGLQAKGKVVPVFNEFKHYAMKAYWGVDV
jgi:hypothetical protein